MVVVVVAASAVVAAAVAATAAEQDDDDDEPQAGTVVVSVVKPHDCHLTLRHSMRQSPLGSLTVIKNLKRTDQISPFRGIQAERNGGFNGRF